MRFSNLFSLRQKKTAFFVVAVGSISAFVLVSPGVTDDAALLAPTSDFTAPERYETNQGGAGTFRGMVSTNAFSMPSTNISLEARLDFMVGNGFFRRLWVTAPSSTKSSDGLGPLYNARACQRCHIKDGRGHPPSANWPDDNAISMLLRLSVPPTTEQEHLLLQEHRVNTIPDPVYGSQLQDFAIPGLSAEGRIVIEYEEFDVVLDDGTSISLHRPTYSIKDLGYGPLADDIMMSPRIAPPMIGLGLLEVIAETDILKKSDPEDLDGDGISGRPNIVWNKELDKPQLGRFGWKAGEPTLNQQNSHALTFDIGLATPVSPHAWGDCTSAQEPCIKAPHGNDADGLEATAEIMKLILFYSRNLAVPARRDVGSSTVLDGKRLFYNAGCIACHTPKYITPSMDHQPEQSRQLIWPYTDLLLHDMGEGLADHRPEGMASGTEWRTPPLWGIGLTQAVSGHTNFLHDGRARNLVEAILWHGGEAQSARDRFAAMSAEERANLLTFLESL